MTIAKLTTEEELAALLIRLALRHLEDSQQKKLAGDERGRVHKLYAAAVAAGEFLFSSLINEDSEHDPMKEDLAMFGAWGAQQ